MKKSSHLKNQQVRNSFLQQQYAPDSNSLMMSQDRIFSSSDARQPQVTSGSNKRKKVVASTEFRKTSNGPLSRKAAY